MLVQVNPRFPRLINYKFHHDFLRLRDQYLCHPSSNDEFERSFLVFIFASQYAYDNGTSDSHIS